MIRVHVPREDEWQKARELRLRALRDTPLAYLETLETALQRSEGGWRERVGSTPTRCQFVAVAPDDEWIGSMTVLAHEPPPFLVAVFVDPRHRGDGTAGVLLDAATAWVRDRGHDELHLHVGEHNIRARRFYERRGFVANGVVEHFPGHPEPEHEMVLGLG